MRLMKRTYGRGAVIALAVMAIPVIVAIVFLFLPASYGGADCGSVVMPRHLSTSGITDHDKLLDVKVHNAGCSDERAYNTEVVIFCGGGGALAMGMILVMTGSGEPVGRLH